MQNAVSARRAAQQTTPLTGMRLDLLVSRPDRGGYLAVELKHLTAAWAGEDDGEHFEVLLQGAQDIRAYDVVKDVRRVERLVDMRPGWSGLVLVPANDGHRPSKCCGKRGTPITRC